MKASARGALAVVTADHWCHGTWLLGLSPRIAHVRPEHCLATGSWAGSRQRSDGGAAGATFLAAREKEQKEEADE